MFSEIGTYALAPSGATMSIASRHKWAEKVGAKGAGLALMPPPWTPSFFAITTDLYREWLNGDGASRQLLVHSEAAKITGYCDAQLLASRKSGIVLRSSSVRESLNERGAYETLEMPADYGTEAIALAIQKIFKSYECSGSNEAIAIVVQTRAQVLFHGHVSNERRVSKTINHWMWEAELPAEGEGRFNSQRSSPPDIRRALLLANTKESSFLPMLRRIGRWCTELGTGRGHLEFGISADQLWLFQLDFEDDQPDLGCDPRELLRAANGVPTGLAPLNSPLRKVGLFGKTGWSKIDKVSLLAEGRLDPYPRLHFITGDAFHETLASRESLVNDIHDITHGRAVCRTDCSAEGVPRVNLPRTESVSAEEAVRFMADSLAHLEAKGAAHDEICFILHKFIPATSAAWALARPDRQIVLVDALWGLPDGLQYLNHDTFEFDIRRDEVSSERLRFKPFFLQEAQNGDWRLIRVSRSLTRHKSLSTRDLREVAHHSHEVAKRLGRAVQIMWFCDVAEESEVGRNVPWFMMPPENVSSSPRSPSIAPGVKRFVIRNRDAIAIARALPANNCVLMLEPEAELFRDNAFLEEVATLAKEKNFPVSLTGSILSHAFYVLERANVSVITVASARARTRQRQVYKKLVRDEIPNKIAEQGEDATLAQISRADARAALTIKLFEEAQELLAANTVSEVTGELADLLEILKSLSATTGVPWSDVEKAADEKRRTRGSFEKNVVLLETSWPGWEKTESSGKRRTISLKDLGRVIDSGRHHSLSFPNVVVPGAENVVQLSCGARLAVRMSATGVSVEEIDEKIFSQRQISFDFD